MDAMCIVFCDTQLLTQIQKCLRATELKELVHCVVVILLKCGAVSLESEPFQKRAQRSLPSSMDPDLLSQSFGHLDTTVESPFNLQLGLGLGT